MHCLRECAGTRRRASRRSGPRRDTWSSTDRATAPRCEGARAAAGPYGWGRDTVTPCARTPATVARCAPDGDTDPTRKCSHLRSRARGAGFAPSSQDSSLPIDRGRSGRPAPGRRDFQGDRRAFLRRRPHGREGGPVVPAAVSPAASRESAAEGSAARPLAACTAEPLWSGLGVAIT